MQSRRDLIGVERHAERDTEVVHHVPSSLYRAHLPYTNSFGGFSVPCSVSDDKLACAACFLSKLIGDSYPIDE